MKWFETYVEYAKSFPEQVLQQAVHRTCKHKGEDAGVSRQINPTRTRCTNYN